jgi:hypothetical protein
MINLLNIILQLIKLLVKINGNFRKPKFCESDRQ